MPTSRETLCYEQSEHKHLLWPQIAYNRLPCWPRLLCLLRLPTRAAPEPILYWAHTVSLILQQQMKVTTSTKSNKSFFPVGCSNTLPASMKSVVLLQTPRAVWFLDGNLHFGWGWIYPYPGGKYQGWDLRDFPTHRIFADINSNLMNSCKDRKNLLVKCSFYFLLRTCTLTACN